MLREGLNTMFVRKLDDLIGTDKEMKLTDGGKFLRSLRFLTKEDGCGFSMSDVLIKGGWSIDLHYKNHMEVNFIAGGQVTVQDLTLNKSWTLGPGMLYVVGPKDRHRVSTHGDAHLVSLFNPALTGTERPDPDGTLEPTGEVPPAWQGETGRTMFVMGDEDAHHAVLRGGRPAPWRTATSGTARTSFYLSPDDGCGLTISLPRGTADSMLWYRNHIEANYVLEGEATVEDLATGQEWQLGPGSLYVVGPRDRHRLKAEKEVYFMSIFNPPLKGDETRDADGAYPPTGEIPPAWRA
ncbi:MAG: ectoine synthase [Chloroflexi bacterium]|nr:ectoine synthase [Chloroflexota bacterium]